MSHTRQTHPETLNPEPFLPCERLDVYRVALQFRQSLRILESVRNISAQRGQLFRAADSVVLNIAAGAGRSAQADKRRHYSYAKGSAMECGAALALLHGESGFARVPEFDVDRIKVGLQCARLRSEKGRARSGMGSSLPWAQEKEPGRNQNDEDEGPLHSGLLEITCGESRMVGARAGRRGDTLLPTASQCHNRSACGACGRVAC